MRILVVDDHPIFQQGVSNLLLEDFPSAKVVGVASAREAMQEFSGQKCDLVILDLNLPDRNGLDVLREMKELQPKTPILILTLYEEDRFAVRALRAGADGYLTKEANPKFVAQAVTKIVGGGKFVTTTVAEKLAFQIGTAAAPEPHELLSDREFQVLGLLAQGKSLGIIADELNLSVNTISTYRTRILDKLSLKTTADLITYAVRNSLVE